MMEVVKILLVVLPLVAAVVVLLRRSRRPLKRAGVMVGLTDAAAAGIHADLVAAAVDRPWEVTGAEAERHRVRDAELRARGSQAVQCDSMVAGRTPRAFTAASWRARTANPGGVAIGCRLHDLTFAIHPQGAPAPRFCAAPLGAMEHPRRLLPEQFWARGHVGEGLVAWGEGLDPPLMQWIASLAHPLAAAGCWVACLGDRVVLFGEGEPTLEVLERRIALGAWLADALEQPPR